MAVASGAARQSPFADAFTKLAHELVHVRQYAELGPDAFVNNYLLEWARSGFRYASGDPFEAEAYTYEQAVAAFLAQPVVDVTAHQRCERGGVKIPH